MDYLWMFGSGILLALANLIPGVSGGTIAVVCKIYDKLLAVFSLDLKKIKTEWKSYLFLILGMIIGIFGLSYLIKYLLDNFPLQSNFFFLGIILGSIPMIYDLIITAITERNFLFLLAPAFGIALGCVTGARLIDWLLKRYSRETYGAILGLVAGSGVVLCEGFSFTPAGIGALIVMVIAACIAFLFTRKE